MNLLLYLLLICIIYQIAYVLVLLIAIICKKRKKNNPTQIKALSVIICAKNEQQNLLENLPLIYAQQYPVFEVIIVDDGSEIPFSQQHEKLTVIRVTSKEKRGLGKKYALQKGVAAARYPWVLLTDADCKPASNQWLTGMTACAGAKSKIVLGISPYYQEATILNSLIEYETAQTALQYAGFAICKKPYMSVGRNVLYETALLKSKTWSNLELSIASGDDDLTIQALARGNNTTVCLEKESYTFSRAKNSWSNWFIQKKRHYQTGRLYRFSDRLLLGSYLLTKLSIYLLSFILLWSAQARNAIYLLLVFILCNTFLQFVLNKKTDLNKRWAYTFINDFLFCIFTIILGLNTGEKSKEQWK